MNEALRRLFVTRINAGINIVAPGSLFERFGACFLDALLPVKLIHRGLNIEGNPVGGTIDTYSDDGRIAAEYSIEKDYFHGALKKGWKDLRHVLDKHPQASDVYLLSSQECGPTKLTFINRHIGQCKQKRIFVYDSRRIAEEITDNLLICDRTVENLSEFVPQLTQVSEELSASELVPAIDPLHVPREDLQKLISLRLENRKSCILSGIGGNGKSAEARAYARSHMDMFDLSIWIDAKSLDQAEKLKSWNIGRRGQNSNVASILSKFACLLVLDDLPPSVNIATIEEMCGADSRVIITSGPSCGGDHIEIPPLDRARAKMLVDSKAPHPCPEEAFEVLWQAIGGHPFTLGVIAGKLRAQNDWNDFAADCTQIPEILSSGVSIRDYLLGRVKSSLERELSLFVWLKSAVCDQSLYKAALGRVALSNLEESCLLAADRPSLRRLHSIAYLTISGDTLDSAADNHLRDKLASAIRQAARRNDLSLTSLSR